MDVIKHSRIESHVEVLSEAQKRTISSYVLSQLRERTRHIVHERRKGRTWLQIGDVCGIDFTTAHHTFCDVQAQFHLALNAPWMEPFREEVLDGKEPPLPVAVQKFNAAEMKARLSLTPKQKNLIAISEETLALRIAKEVRAPLRAVLGELKTEGKWPLLDNAVLLGVLEEVEGNVSEVARRLQLDRTRLVHRFEKLGVHGTGTHYNGPGGKNEQRNGTIRKKLRSVGGKRPSRVSSRR